MPKKGPKKSRDTLPLMANWKERRLHTIKYFIRR
jgi:hypothetical protein